MKLSVTNPQLSQHWFSLILAYAGIWKCLFAAVVLKIIFYYCYKYEKPAPTNDYKVCIVGAGFSGIGMAIKLKQMGIDNVVLEAAPELGGTWQSSVYPGCGCDISSHLYEFSFEPNPRWNRKFARRKEIHEYLKEVARKYDLKIKYNTKVKSANWLNDQQCYEIIIDNGNVLRANFVVHCAGALRVPNIPDFKGQDRFVGPRFHSSNWDTNCDIRGKKVAVIGTGATAVQIVPAIARQVKQLMVFQRTPCWCPPRHDFGFPDAIKFIFSYVPGVHWLYRFGLFAYQEAIYLIIMCKNSPTTGIAKWVLSSHIRRVVRDPILAEKLIPKYSPGCKRITPSDQYLQTFNHKNVELVTDAIAEIQEDCILTSEGNNNGKTYEVDVIVYATGYSPLRSLIEAFEISNGPLRFADVMHQRPSAYLGATVPFFPNLFLLFGPHCHIGHNSVVWLIECQINYIADCLRQMARDGLRSASVRHDIATKFENDVKRWMENKIFRSGCKSWYTNDYNGVNYAVWPTTPAHFWWLTRSANLSEYQVA